MVVVVAHTPPPGVNVYVVGPTLAEENAGDQLPEMPSMDVPGKGFAEFWQIGPIAAKVGVTGSVTKIVIGYGFAHCPGSGVNV